MSPRIILSILFIIFLNHNTKTFRRHWSETGVKGWRIICFPGSAAVRFRSLFLQTWEQLRSQEFTEIINDIWYAHKFWRVPRAIKITLANYFFNNYVPRLDNLYIWTKIVVMFFTSSPQLFYTTERLIKIFSSFCPVEFTCKNGFSSLSGFGQYFWNKLPWLKKYQAQQTLLLKWCQCFLPSSHGHQQNHRLKLWLCQESAKSIFQAAQISSAFLLWIYLQRNYWIWF